MDVLRSKFSTRHAALRTLLRGLAGVSVASAMAGVAVAQQPASTRAAALLPPIAAVPTVARGAIGDAPVSALDSTPVARKAMKPGVPPAAMPPSGPAWLSGIDPNVLPAGATTPVPTQKKTSAKLALTDTPPLISNSPQTVPTLPAPLATRVVSDLAPAPAPTRVFFNPPPPPAPSRVIAVAPAAPPATVPFPTGTPPEPTRPVADANAPLQGTGANGAPVLAGPPAWRWYGYGTVTPGANTYAPGGEYPRGSSNWYSVTKATPGAFPVPVANPRYPATTGGGGAPPSYFTSAPTRTAFIEPRGNDAFPSAPPGFATPAQPPVAKPTMPSAVVPQIKPAVLPPVDDTPRMLPAIPPPAAPTAARPPVGVPTLAPPPITGPVAPAKLPEPIVAAPPMPAVEPEPEPARTPATLTATKPVFSAKPVTPPAPLPGAITDEVKWQTTPDAADIVPPGTWVPATGKPRTGVRPASESNWQPVATNLTRPLTIARGQAADAPQADPVATLIRGVCRGRANEIDVRWTGSKKLMVCFEVRTPPDAAALVRDISARPELASFQIDFCVLVK